MARVAVPILIGAIGVAVLMSLGIWQMQRLAWKEAVLASIDARLAADPVAVPEAPDAATDQYLAVALRGATSGPELHVLVSHKQKGPGYRVVRRFDDDSGRSFLLDMGFVKQAEKDATRAPLQGDVTGNLNWPDDRNGSTPENDVDANIWFARDVDAMAAILGTEPLLVVLREAAELPEGITPLPVDSSTIPNDHLEYAITWFSLALVWLGMTVYWVWRITRRKEQETN